jgi:hypothetical protein
MLSLKKNKNINEIIGWHIMKFSLVFLNADGSTYRKPSSKNILSMFIFYQQFN